MEGKKTLSAKEVIFDIRAGATDDFLMKKYGISEKGLKSLFQKLISAKLLTQEILDSRIAQTEEVYELEPDEIEPVAPAKKNIGQAAVESGEKPSPTVSRATYFTCPACKLPQKTEFKICPQCGIIVEKFLQRQNEKVEKKPDSTEEPKEPQTSDDAAPKNSKKWFENQYAVILMVIVFFPLGLYLLWKSTGFHRNTKIVVTAALGLLLAVGLTLQSRNSTKGAGIPTPSGMQVVEAKKDAPSASKMPVVPSDCDQPEVPYPIEPVTKDSSARQMLAAIHSIEVVEGRNPTDHKRLVSKKILKTDEPPSVSQLIKYILESDYSCTSGKGGDGQVNILVVSSIFESAFNNQIHELLKSDTEKEKENESLQDKKRWETKTEREAEKPKVSWEDKELNELIVQLNKKGHFNCVKGVKDIAMLARSTAAEIAQKTIAYRLALQEQQTKYRECREKIRFAEIERQKKAAEENAKRAAIENQKRAQESEQHARAIKSGTKPVKTIEDAKIKYDSKDGDDYVENPPFTVPNENRYILLSGRLDDHQDDVLICDARNEYDDNDRLKIKKWGFRSGTIKSYIPRVGKHVEVIGKISKVLHGKNAFGKSIYMIVVDAVAIECDGELHQQ